MLNIRTDNVPAIWQYFYISEGAVDSWFPSVMIQTVHYSGKKQWERFAYPACVSSNNRCSQFSGFIICTAVSDCIINPTKYIISPFTGVDALEEKFNSHCHRTES